MQVTSTLSGSGSGGGTSLWWCYHCQHRDILLVWWQDDKSARGTGVVGWGGREGITGSSSRGKGVNGWQPPQWHTENLGTLGPVVCCLTAELGEMVRGRPEWDGHIPGAMVSRGQPRSAASLNSSCSGISLHILAPS